MPSVRATTRVLIGFRAFSVLTLTGPLSGNGILSCGQAFSNARDAIQKAFCYLRPMPLFSRVTDALEEYVCKLYHSDTGIVRLTELRWWMFWRKKELQKLPPSRAVFLEVSNVRNINALFGNPHLTLILTNQMPDIYRWKRDCDKYIAFMKTLPPAPEAPLQPIKCGCSKSVCETCRCKYKASQLYCTDLYCCGAEEDPCKTIVSG